MTALPEPDRGRIPELDGIRGTAILLVLIWHYILCEGLNPPPLFRFLMQTWSGVDLFFVLSGFLIGGILLDHRDASNYFSVFYRRRVCRILPIYFAWLLLFVLLRPLQPRLGGWLFNDAFPLWSYATFTQNFLQERYGTWGANWLGITWSLAIEEQFYLILPLVIRLTPTRRLPFVIAPFIIAAPFIRAALWPGSSDWPQAHVLLFCKADALLLGVLCAWIVRRPGGAARVRSAAPMLRILLFACAGFAVIATYVPETMRTRVATESLLAIGYAALILLAVYVSESPVARLMRVAWLRNLGIIAYGTYLIHQGVSGIVFGLARRRPPMVYQASDLLLVALALAITIAAAAISWRWFEKPIVDIGRRWNYVTRSGS